MRKLAVKNWSGSSASTTSAAPISVATGLIGRFHASATSTHATIRNERTAEGASPVTST
ncbi:MAG: hypothetical protein BWX86_01740 [Verrucomicrobia bacterium ADurb.Bin122]|nr:MAG: hypothetical protein BWX86_01740 [Verrucomicrobia bacterium ADurb.Bin122]